MHLENTAEYFLKDLDLTQIPSQPDRAQQIDLEVRLAEANGWYNILTGIPEISQFLTAVADKTDERFHGTVLFATKAHLKYEQVVPPSLIMRIPFGLYKTHGIYAMATVHQVQHIERINFGINEQSKLDVVYPARIRYFGGRGKAYSSKNISLSPEEGIAIDQFPREGAIILSAHIQDLIRRLDLAVSRNDGEEIQRRIMRVGWDGGTKIDKILYPVQ